MSLGAIGAVLVVLVLVLIAGSLWLHSIEGILDGLRLLLPHKARPWRPLPTGTGEEAEPPKASKSKK